MGTDLLGIGEALCDIACEKGFTDKLNFIGLNKYTVDQSDDTTYSDHCQNRLQWWSNLVCC